MAYGASAPKPDKRIGKAADASAKLGRDYLTWAKERAAVTDQWASEDRSRFKRTFQPLQDRFIKEAAAYDSPGRQAAAAAQARADVGATIKAQQDAQNREAAAMGVNPASGRWAGMRRAMGMDAALASYGAANVARRETRDVGRALRADAVNMGSGLGVNPLSARVAGNAVGGNGFSGAMAGLGQQIQGRAALGEQRFASAEMSNQGTGAMMEGVGTLAGFAMFSDKKAKTDVSEPKGSAVEQVNSMPVKEWRYKAGVMDGGAEKHVGTMAQDFKKATGKGDGKTIPIVDAVGTLMRAVQEIDGKVTRIARGIGGGRAMA
jgi:hypothetical protein